MYSTARETAWSGKQLAKKEMEEKRMKSYEVLKKELQERRSNIKGFNKEFYKIFVADREKAIKIFESGEAVSDFWKTCETSKTWFYKNNSGAYCELLQLCY